MDNSGFLNTTTTTTTAAATTATIFFSNGSTALAGPWPLLQFRNNFFYAGRTPWTSDKPVARPLHTHRAT
jgi:hypothetical protein